MLVKGSRFMRMERVVAALCGSSGAGRGALMLLWLTELLAKDVRAFNVFGYLTLRAVLRLHDGALHLVHRRSEGHRRGSRG